MPAEPEWLAKARAEGRITETRASIPGVSVVEVAALDIDRIHQRAASQRPDDTTPLRFELPIPPSAKGKSKFLNRKVELDGHTFDSRKEAARYTELVQLLKLGMIADLRLQVAFPIIVNGVTVCKYVADFVYRERLNGDEFGEVIEDVKSAFTRKNPVYRLKKKLLEASTGKKIRET